MDALVVFSVLLSILIHPSFQEAGKQLEKTFWSEILIREVCGKSKWKFKMAFAMKGGRGLEGVSFAIKLF